MYVFPGGVKKNMAKKGPQTLPPPSTQVQCEEKVTCILAMQIGPDNSNGGASQVNASILIDNQKISHVNLFP